jgi:hypothetical protein
MPFKSKSQSKAFHAMENDGRMKKGTAHKWAHETPGGVRNLPERVKKRGRKGRAKHRKGRR